MGWRGGTRAKTKEQCKTQKIKTHGKHCNELFFSQARVIRILLVFAVVAKAVQDTRPSTPHLIYSTVKAPDANEFYNL